MRTASTTSQGRSSRVRSRRPADIRAVIFDLDGLLLDTESILHRVDSEAVARYGGVLTDELRQRTIGLTHEAKDRLLVEELRLRVAPERLSDERAAALEVLWPAAALKPGAASLVAALAAARMPLAIASNSTDQAARAKLERHRAITSVVTAVVTSDHPRVGDPKPAPDIYVAAAFELGVDPVNCLAFEDAPSGIESALAAGMTVVAVPDPNLPRHPILDSVHQVLPSLLDFDAPRLGIRL